MTCRVLSTPAALILLIASSMSSSPAEAATGLPFSSSFETGDFSEWHGGLDASLTVTSESATDGRYSARAVMVRGQGADNYKDYVFGDHPRVRGLPVATERGMWIQFDSRFDEGFEFSSSASYHKMAIINFEDESGRRRYQVVLNVITRTGEYFIERLVWNADRSFNKALPGLSQNIGPPARVRLGQWDRVVLYVRPNTPGYLDGEIRLWINGEIKSAHANISIREDTSFNPNKLILSNYAPDSTTSGVQRWDHFRADVGPPPIPVRPSPPKDLVAE